MYKPKLSDFNLDPSKLSKYELDLSRGIARSDGPEDHARLLEAIEAIAPGNLSQPLIRAQHQGYPHTFTCFGSAIATALGTIPVLRGLSAPATHAFAVRGRTCALQAPLL
ncbi:hypothetical protein SAMN04489708_13156, partial [Paracidovorax cattleyae]